MDISRITTLAKQQGKTITHICKLINRPNYYLKDIRAKNLAMPPEYLTIIAADLGTTPEYLSGETDESGVLFQDQPAPAHSLLSLVEFRLIEDYRAMSNAGQKWVRQAMAIALNFYGANEDDSDGFVGQDGFAI